MAQQGPRPPRRGRLPTGNRRGEDRRGGWESWEDAAGTGEEPPPWAGPAVGPRWAGEPARRPAHGRNDDGDRPGTSHASTSHVSVGRHSSTGGHASTGGRTATGGHRDGGAGLDTGTGDTWRGGNTWAEPDYGLDPEAPGPGSRSRRAAARSRRRSRIIWIWGGAAVAVAAIAVVLFVVIGGGPGPAKPGNGLVTTFQPGELETVPNVCTAVSPATLGKYLPGKLHRVVPHSLYGSAQSLCNWTLDAPPLYRVLAVTAQAYSPSGLATGNGSATSAAKDAYQQAMQTLRQPAKATHLPPALVTSVRGVGTTAFAALQVVLARGDATNLVTVVVRDHNVVVTVVFQGPHARNGSYRPAAPAQLQAGAITAARNVVSRLH